MESHYRKNSKRKICWQYGIFSLYWEYDYGSKIMELMEFRIRVVRYAKVSSERVDEIEDMFGPSSSISTLFERLGKYLESRSITDEYRAEVAKMLVQRPCMEPEHIWPYIMSFTVSMETNYLDNYIVEAIVD